MASGTPAQRGNGRTSQYDRALHAMPAMPLNKADHNGYDNPITRASIALGWRLVVKPNGDAYLDGRRVQLKRAIEAANVAIAGTGMEPIRYPGVQV